MTKQHVTFEGWMRLVDVFLVERIGLDSGSVEDWNWFEEYEAGTMPINAVAMFCDEIWGI